MEVKDLPKGSSFLGYEGATTGVVLAVENKTLIHSKRTAASLTVAAGERKVLLYFASPVHDKDRNARPYYFRLFDAIHSAGETPPLCDEFDEMYLNDRVDLIREKLLNKRVYFVVRTHCYNKTLTTGIEHFISKPRYDDLDYVGRVEHAIDWRRLERDMHYMDSEPRPPPPPDGADPYAAHRAWLERQGVEGGSALAPVSILAPLDEAP